MNAILNTISDLFNNTQELLAYPEKQFVQDGLQRHFPFDCVNRSDLIDKDGNQTGKRLEILIPGFKKDEISLSLKDGEMTLKAERKNEKNDSRPVRTGFSIKQRIECSIAIDKQIDAGGISSRLENGILTIDMPFLKKSSPESVRIEIE